MPEPYSFCSLLPAVSTPSLASSPAPTFLLCPLSFLLGVLAAAAPSFLEFTYSFFLGSQGFSGKVGMEMLSLQKGQPGLCWEASESPRTVTAMDTVY